MTMITPKTNIQWYTNCKWCNSKACKSIEYFRTKLNVLAFRFQIQFFMYMHWWKKAHQEPFSLDFFVQKRALIGSWNRLSWRVQVLWKHTHTYQRCEVLVPGYSEINHFLEGSWLFASKKMLWPMFLNRKGGHQKQIQF